jgi:hypothetical protein
MMQEIHVTERAMFKRCRRKWKYQCRWELVPKEEKRGALWIGTGVHYGLAEYYRSKRDPWEAAQEWLDQKLPELHLEDMWPEERAQFNASTDLMASILVGYVPFAQANDDFEIISVEEALRIPIPHTRVVLVGQMDVLARRAGKLWVMDHKTAAQYVDITALEMDDQMTAYLWMVWQAHDEIPGGALYNELRKKVPAQPEILVRGGLSKKKNIDTTYEIYLNAIKANDLDPKDYADILEFLRNKPDGFYRRELVARTKYELEHFAENLIPEAKAMNSKNTPLYPSPTRDCSWDCQYRDLCLCETTGGHLEGLIDSLYEHSPGGRRQL